MKPGDMMIHRNKPPGLHLVLAVEDSSPTDPTESMVLLLPPTGSSPFWEYTSNLKTP